MFRPLHWAIIRSRIVPQRRLYSVVFATRCRCEYYEGHLESKERFAIKKYLLIIGKKDYAGFITHLHLLLHIVTLDIEAIVVP